MPVFVMFGDLMGGTRPAAQSAGAILSRNLRNQTLQKLLRLHTSWPLNKKHSLPGHSIWYKFFLDENRIKHEEEVYFVLYEGFRLAYSRSYLEHLKKEFKRSKFIFCFRNPVNPVNLAQWEVLKTFYDAGVSLCRQDAIDYGLHFCDYWPCMLPYKQFQPENSSDVFFVAQAKDRLPKILSAYEHLVDAGLKCDFHVVGVPENEQKYTGEIHYNRPISYSEVLQKTANTKCVMEILPFGKCYSSLRVCEALWYHKKILTTNIDAKFEWFYGPEIVQTFKDSSEFDTSFITHKLSSEEEQEDFGALKIGDFKIFAERIMSAYGMDKSGLRKN